MTVCVVEGGVADEAVGVAGPPLEAEVRGLGGPVEGGALGEDERADREGFQRRRAGHDVAPPPGGGDPALVVRLVAGAPREPSPEFAPDDQRVDARPRVVDDVADRPPVADDREEEPPVPVGHLEELRAPLHIGGDALTLVQQSETALGEVEDENALPEDVEPNRPELREPGPRARGRAVALVEQDGNVTQLERADLPAEGRGRIAPPLSP